MAERLPEKLERLLLEEEKAYYEDRQELLASSTLAARDAAESSDTSRFLAPHDRSETPESRLPEALLLRIFSFCAAEDLCRCACVGWRWRHAAEDDRLWKLVCKSTINHYHPLEGPMGTSAALNGADKVRALAAAGATTPSSGSGSSAATETPAKVNNTLAIRAGMAALDPLSAAILTPLLSPTATPISPGTLAEAFPSATAAAAGPGSILPPLLPAADMPGAAAAAAPPPAERQEVSLSIARQKQLDLEAAREAKLQAERDAYKAARDLMIALFKSSVLAAKPKPSYRLGFRSIALVRLNGFYSCQHRYIRTPLVDMFHKVDGILTVTYHRAFRFYPDGRCCYVLANGKLSDVVKSFRAAFPLLDKFAPTPTSAAADRHPLRARVVAGGAFGDRTVEDIDEHIAPAGAAGGAGAAAGGTGAGGSRRRTAKEIREEKEQERLNQNLGFGYYQLWGDTIKAVISLGQTVTHWTLTVSSSPAFYEDERIYNGGKAASGAGGGKTDESLPLKPAIPAGWMDRLTIQSAILCEYGATLEQGSAISSLESEEFSFTPLEWSRV
jgi:F-box-like/F-box only protein C-terminal region